MISASSPFPPTPPTFHFFFFLHAFQMSTFHHTPKCIVCSQDMKCHAHKMQNNILIFMILPKHDRYYVLHCLVSTLSAQFQGEISQSNVKGYKFFQHLKFISYSARIILKSVGEVALLHLFFLPPLSPGPMLSKI